MTVDVTNKLAGDVEGIKLRDSVDTSDGGSAWIVRSIHYTRDTEFGRRSDPLPVDGYRVRRVIPEINEKLKEYHGPPERQYAIQLKGGGIRVGCSDGSSEDLHATCVTGVSDVNGCGHTSVPLDLRERISLFVPVRE